MKYFGWEALKDIIKTEFFFNISFAKDQMNQILHFFMWSAKRRLQKTIRDLKLVSNLKPGENLLAARALGFIMHPLMLIVFLFGVALKHRFSKQIFLNNILASLLLLTQAHPFLGQVTSAPW